MRVVAAGLPRPTSGGAPAKSDGPVAVARAAERNKRVPMRAPVTRGSRILSSTVEPRPSRALPAGGQP